MVLAVRERAGAEELVGVSEGDVSTVVTSRQEEVVS